jgi:hypothetical protein
VHCDECGYDYNELVRAEVASRVRSFRGRYAMALAAHTHEELRTRPEPDVWSPLEYACHIRDVFRTQTARIALTLEQDTPEYASMRRDERVLEERYNEQDPQGVLRELAVAADELASVFESLDDAGWQRTGIYGYPTREVRTIEWIGRHTCHEGEHHLMDITRDLG